MNRELIESTVETIEPSYLPTQGGKDELNLAEFPIALLSERSPAGVRTLHYQDQIFDSGKKRLVKRRLLIEGSEAYGLPTSKDDEVIVALIQLSKRKGFESRSLEFTRFELLSTLGWANTGQSYARIRLSLHRWVSVTLHYENAWWDKAEERWTSGAFHVIDDFEINDSREQTNQLTLLPSRINWNERVFKSFLDTNLKNLRYDIYVKLKHPTSKRMYRFLDKRFHHAKADERFDKAKSLRFGLKDFAHEHIGLSRVYKDCGKIKEKLQPAIDELEQIGFLEPMQNAERYEKVGKGSWRIALVRKSEKAPSAAEPITIPSPQHAPIGFLVAELIARGVSETTAEELVASFPPDYVATKIEVFDWLVARKDKRASKSPGGYLADSIRKKYATPKDFKTQAERTREEEAKRERERSAAEAKHLQTKAEAVERAERAAINAYREALTPERRKQHEVEAIAQVSEMMRKEYEGTAEPNLRRLILGSILDGHIRTILQGQGKLLAGQ